MRHRSFAAGALLFVVLLLSAAFTTPTLPSSSSAVSAFAQDTPNIGPDIYPDGVNPLTGLPVEDQTILKRRPLVIKVSNYPPIVRPQTGLSQAEVVWEHLLTGGVTRFSAVFLSQDLDKVGPVRSARLIDFELVRIYRALSVYSGMAQGVLDILRGDSLMSSRAIGDIGCPSMCRYPQEGLAYEHTLYANTSEIREAAAELKRDTMPEFIYGMAFSDAPSRTVIGVKDITVQYRETDVRWTYDPASGRWLRFQDGTPHFDAFNNQQLSAANVLIVEEEHTVQPFVAENYWGPGNSAYSVNFIDTGRVFLFRDGGYIEGIWQRGDREDPLKFFDLEGNVLPFKPGNTFINLVPRWIDGYQLVFGLTAAPKVTIKGGEREGVSMRKGPGDAYISLDVAYPGDVFDAVGRNRSQDWVQVTREGQPAVWLPLNRVEMALEALPALPIVRPIIER